jgi:transcription factor SPT20
MSATVVAARPSQALRQRRESQRPSLPRASAAKATPMENGPAKEDMNRYVWTQEAILDKFKGSPPSLRIHLHKNHFRINDSQESLSYASPMKELIQHLKEKTVPHNMLDELYMQGIPFYDSVFPFFKYAYGYANSTQTA